MPPRKIHIPCATADTGGKEIKDDFSVLLQGNRLKSTRPLMRPVSRS